MTLVVRAMTAADWPVVRAIYGEGIQTGDATFEIVVPDPGELDRRWLDAHRWVAVNDGHIAGWAALAPTSARACYAGVVETSVYVGENARWRGVGRALLDRQVVAADDAGLWTLRPRSSRKTSRASGCIGRPGSESLACASASVG